MSFLKFSLPLFLITFLIFNLNINSIGSGDTIPARLLPISILSGHGLYFDNFVGFLQNKYQTIYYFQQFNNHYVSSFPIITGLIAIPFYLPFYIFLILNGVTDISSLYNITTALQKLSASSLASFSVVLFFILIRKISNNNSISAIFALIFAFGSQTFSISSQALWQHGTANLFMIVSQIFLIKALESNYSRKTLSYLLSLTFAILSFWSRPNFFLFWIVIFSFIFWKEKPKIISYFIFSLLGIAILAGYNLYFFNSIYGGYAVQTATFTISSPISNLMGILFSPARGVFFYTPLFILSFLSVLFIKRINKLPTTLKIIFYINYIYFILGIILNSFWGVWWGGHSWGDRLLTDIAVSAIILLYFFYININNFLLKLVFYLFVIYSVFTQIVGVCCYSNSKWDSYPANVDYNHNRLWDFIDNPILRSIKAGPDMRGIKIIQGQ